MTIPFRSEIKIKNRDGGGDNDDSGDNTTLLQNQLIKKGVIYSVMNGRIENSGNERAIKEII
jgi:hypothetical protein